MHMNNTLYTPFFQTDYGKVFELKAEDFLKDYFSRKSEKINLIFTSPPFPLNRKKKYGNYEGQEYIDWLKEIAILCANVLAEDGSIVIEIGNSWDKGQPTFSTLPMVALLEFKAAAKLELCQEFIAFNPSRLPSPIEWVNKRRIRVKDSFTKIWWLSKTPYPKANNLNVLAEYSKSMKKLLDNKKYNSGMRPSEHKIGSTSFLNNNRGAIPPSVLTVNNTISNDKYIKYCRNNKLQLHPARMPRELPEFFIRFLTDENDIVLDPFCGSNTTGEVAETLRRKWISIDLEKNYLEGSIGRFL